MTIKLDRKPSAAQLFKKKSQENALEEVPEPASATEKKEGLDCGEDEEKHEVSYEDLKVNCQL